MREDGLIVGTTVVTVCTCPPGGWSRLCEFASHRGQAAEVGAPAVSPSHCRGFVPRHGFGQARTCSRCNRALEEHAVVVQ